MLQGFKKVPAPIARKCKSLDRECPLHIEGCVLAQSMLMAPFLTELPAKVHMVPQMCQIYCTWSLYTYSSCLECSSPDVSMLSSFSSFRGQLERPPWESFPDFIEYWLLIFPTPMALSTLTFLFFCIALNTTRIKLSLYLPITFLFISLFHHHHLCIWRWLWPLVSGILALLYSLHIPNSIWHMVGMYSIYTNTLPFSLQYEHLHIWPPA